MGAIPVCILRKEKGEEKGEGEEEEEEEESGRRKEGREGGREDCQTLGARKITRSRATPARPATAVEEGTCLSLSPLPPSLPFSLE